MRLQINLFFSNLVRLFRYYTPICYTMLKFAFTATGLLMACPVVSQKILFKYDQAGNRINRSVEAALPVRLANFAAMVEEGSVMLTWKTAGEENLSHFELERSSDGMDWVRIAEIHSPGSDEMVSALIYRHIDHDPEPGQNFYRLKMVDADGTTAWSKLESVFLRSEIRIYPNPARDYLVIECPFQAEVSYEIFAPDGRAILRGRLVGKTRIDLGPLFPALYIIRLTLAPGQTFSRRIVKE